MVSKEVYYIQGDYNSAFDGFTQYIRLIDALPEHFLACKMFGSLLLKQQRYKHSIALLRKALEKRPDDIEVHNMLMECYSAENMSFELEVETTITKLLTCDNLGSLESKEEHRRITSEGSWV